MGVHKFPSIKSYWPVNENLLIQKTITRTRFMEVPWNFHVPDNLQKLPSKGNMDYDRAWKMRALFDHQQKYLQASLKPESNQAIDENSRTKALWNNTWRTNPSNGGSSSVFYVVLNPHIYTTLICTWVKREHITRSLGICGSFILSKVKKYPLLCILWQIFY